MPEAHPPPLKRYSDIGWLGGVCAGFAYRLGWPAWILRMILVLLVFVPVVDVPVVLIYVILWIFMPDAVVPDDFEDRTGHSE